MRVVFLAAALWAGAATAQVSAPPAAAAPPPAPAPAAAPPASDAALPALPPNPAPPPAAPSAPPDELTHFGAMLDVGIPDGAGLSALWRPITFLRINAGVTYNLLGVGVRGGVSFIPFHFAITPTLNADLGHYFSSDASRFATQLVTDPSGQAVLTGALKDVTYDYGNLHLGLEVGSPQRFLFFLRGGLSYLQTTLKNFQGTIQGFANDSTITAADPTVKAVFPSVKLGFILYL